MVREIPSASWAPFTWIPWPKRRLVTFGVAICCCGLPWVSARGEPGLQLRIEADKTSVPMGKSITVTVRATRDGQSAVGQELWAYINGRQWGAQAITDAAGNGTFILPLPTLGHAQVRVAPIPEDFQWSAQTFGQTADFTVDSPLPPQSVVSNPVEVEVTARRFPPKRDPLHLVGTTWYPWFTRYNAHINGGHSETEAVPLLGSYASANPNAIRQQMLWLDEIGVNFVQVDWSNNLTASMHWKDHPPGVDEMVASTHALLDTLAQMRTEGLPTPQVLLLLGMLRPSASRPSTRKCSLSTIPCSRKHGTPDCS